MNNEQSPENSFESIQNPEQLFFRALLENAPDSIYFKDLKGHYRYLSDAKATKCGTTDAQSLIGKSDFDIFAKEHAQKAFSDEEKIIQTGEPIFNLEEKETWPDGRISWVSTSKMPLYNEDGKLVGTFGISSDITPKKLAESRLQATRAELLEASRLAGIAEISSGILHNIGNGLNSVNTSINVLEERLEHSRLSKLSQAMSLLREHSSDLIKFISENEKGRLIPEYLLQLEPILAIEREELQAEVQQLKSFVEHLKAIVAMQQNYSRTSDISEELNPSELIEEAVKISELSLRRHGIDVCRHYKNVPNIKTTRHKALQILVNFIRNSKYAMDETGRADNKTVTLVLDTNERGNIIISVCDNGIGIAPENRHKIFGFGFSTRPGGHGFGLHSSANAAKEIGASIHVESKGTGKGATFTLELPIEFTPFEE